MPIVCWGNLAKSADDTLRIEQSVEDYVEGHNENVNAHQIAGSSLYMHRVNEILDHALGSISLAHLLSDSYLILTCFENISSWSTSGHISTNIFNAGLFTDATTNYASEAQMWDILMGNVMDFSKNPFFQTTVFLQDTTNQVVYFVAGRFWTPPTTDYFGFKVVNNTLYACWTHGEVESTYEITGITLTARNVYRAYIDSANSKLYFYVNGVLKYTLEADLPETPGYYMFTYYIKTTANERKDFNFSDLLIQVDR